MKEKSQITNKERRRQAQIKYFQKNKIEILKIQAKIRHKQVEKNEL